MQYDFFEEILRQAGQNTKVWSLSFIAAGEEPADFLGEFMGFGIERRKVVFGSFVEAGMKKLAPADFYVLCDSRGTCYRASVGYGDGSHFVDEVRWDGRKWEEESRKLLRLCLYAVNTDELKS